MILVLKFGCKWITLLAICLNLKAVFENPTPYPFFKLNSQKTASPRYLGVNARVRGCVCLLFFLLSVCNRLSSFNIW